MEQIAPGPLPADLLCHWFEQTPLDYARHFALWPVALGTPDDAACEALHAAYVEAELWDEAAACCIAALQARWEAGREPALVAPWLARAAQLETEGKCSAMAQAALVVSRLIAELFWHCRLADLRSAMPDAWALVEASGSDALRIVLAACEGYARIMAGELHAAEEGLKDAVHFAPDPAQAFVPKLHLAGCMGLLDAVRGRFGTGQRALVQALEHPALPQWPATLVLMLRANRLLGLAQTGTPDEIETAANALRAIALPHNKAAHRGYLHFALGVSHLQRGEAAHAITHSQMALDQGLLSGSASACVLPALLQLQAYADAQRDEAARGVLTEWLPRWQAGGFSLVLCAALLEQAQLDLRAAQPASARSSLQAALAALPSGEDLPDYHRAVGHSLKLQQCLGRATDAGQPAHPKHTHIRIHTFGGLRIHIGDRELFDRDWHGARGKSLLKALIVHGGSKISVDVLSDLLWPDAEGAQARQNLKVALSRLRHVFSAAKELEAPPWVATQHGHVSLVGTWCWVDSIEFERELQAPIAGDIQTLATTLSLYQGDFLAHDESESWIAPHRERLQRMYVKGAQELALACLESGTSGVGEAHLERAIALAPLDERNYEQLMRLQMMAGYPGLAAATYDRARANLIASGHIKPDEPLAPLRAVISGA